MENLLKIELSSKRQYSFGFYHSGIDLFHHLYLKNLTNENYENLTVSFQTTPNILLKGSCVVDSLLPEGDRFLSCDFLKLDLSAVASVKSLTEISVRIVVKKKDGSFLCAEDFSVKLLPYFWFLGASSHPESVSFFVTPNQTEIAEISDPIRYSDFLDFSKAVYDFVKSKKITFSSEDYSGNVPLPVRLPERVLREGFGNPLELSLLFASCCEHVGFFPVLAFAGKGKVFVGLREEDRKLKLVTELDKTKKNLEGIHFIDGSYFAFGSELTFEQALFHSKNTLSLSDEKILIVDLVRARKHELFPLPNRFSEGGNWLLEDASSCYLNVDNSEKEALLNQFSTDKRITAILSGEHLPISAHKAGYSFQPDLDVNQNKILSKILSNDFTLVRAQMGTGASTLLTHAASIALKSGKSILFVTDSSYHSDGIERIVPRYFDSDFLFNSARLEQPYKKSDFSGFFEELDEVYEIKEKAESLLNRFDQYYESLEGDRRIVSSFLFAADRYHQLKDANESIVFSPEQIGRLSDDEVQLWFSTVNQLVKSYLEIGSVSENPLALIQNKKFSYEYKSQLILNLEDLLSFVKRIVRLREQIDPYFPSLGGNGSSAVFLSFLELIRLFGEFPFVPVTFFDSYTHIDENFRKVTHLIQAKKENDSITETILISFEDGIFDLDAKNLHDRYLALSNDKSLKGMSQRHAILKSIKRYLRPNCDVENIEYIFSRLHTYQKNQKFIAEEKDFVFNLFSVPMKDGAYDWNTLQLVSDLCYQCYSVFLSVFSADRLPAFVADYHSASASAVTMNDLDKLREAFEEFTQAKETFEASVSNQLHFFYSELMGRDVNYFQLLFEKLSNLLSNADHLKEWCTWLQLKDKADEIGLKNLTSAIESGKLAAAECKRSFLRAFFKAVCEYNFIVRPELLPGSFPIDECKKNFEDCLKDLKEIKAKELNTLLSIRRLDAHSDFDEEEILPHELLEANPQAFFNVYPCSVFDVHEALEIFGNHYRFDYVFIESRNHVTLRDFIRLLSMGKKVSFVGMLSELSHNRICGCDLNASAFDYLWSISDEKYSLSAVYQADPCMVSLQSAFASAIRSDVRMYTVPSAIHKQCGEWVTLRGNYDLEYEGANLAEAEYCVERLIRFALKEHKKTIGIVTLTKQQKNLILRLLSQKLRHQEELARCFSDYSRFHVFSIHETLCFCDELLFSVTYAPNRALPASGFPYAFHESCGVNPYKVIFEIICSAGESFTLVSSFAECDLNVSPSSLDTADAIHLLCKVLGSSATNNSFRLVGAFEDASVILDMQHCLKNRGYKVLSGIQNGRYYLDLAVQDDNGNFIMGIISDKTITNQKSNIAAIEFLNEAFYKKSGWTIFRLRSADCFDSFEKELDRICNVLSPNEPFDFI